MSAPHAGFRSREEMQREQALTGQYRQIGIKAVASASVAAKCSAPRQMAGQTQSQPQFGAVSSDKPQQQR